MWTLAILAMANWLGPGLFLLYPLLLRRDFRFDGWHGPFLCFELEEELLPWHARLWRDWWGVGLHWFMCYRATDDAAQKARGVLHEGAHCWHGAALGLAYWVFYLGHMLILFVWQRVKGPPYAKHPYLDCWSERLARKRASQLVDVPPDQWPQGPNDLWPWW